MAREFNLLLLCFVVRGDALTNSELILKNSAPKLFPLKFNL